MQKEKQQYIIGLSLTAFVNASVVKRVLNLQVGEQVLVLNWIEAWCEAGRWRYQDHERQ